MNDERFSVIGDLNARVEQKDISEVYRKHSEHGLQDDESLYLNWRVISNETGRTMCVFAGGAGHDAAIVFRDYCEANY